MDFALITTRQALREHGERLEKASRVRQATEAHRRKRIRSGLRKAILETVKLDGSTTELVTEFSRLVQRAEHRFSGRPCC